MCDLIIKFHVPERRSIKRVDSSVRSGDPAFHPPSIFYQIQIWTMRWQIRACLHLHFSVFIINDLCIALLFDLFNCFSSKVKIKRYTTHRCHAPFLLISFTHAIGKFHRWFILKLVERMRTSGRVYNVAVLGYEKAALLLINNSLSHHPGHSIPS